MSRSSAGAKSMSGVFAGAAARGERDRCWSSRASARSRSAIGSSPTRATGHCSESGENRAARTSWSSTRDVRQAGAAAADAFRSTRALEASAGAARTASARSVSGIMGVLPRVERE